MKNLKGNLLLALAAFIWGTAFVAQSTGLKHISPFMFNTIRNILGCLVLIPVIIFTAKKKKTFKITRELITGGILCGIALCFASNFQQFGLLEAEPGKAGFITSLYIIIVPLIQTFGGKKITKNAIVAIVIAIVGMYLLCMSESLSINKGELLVFICSIFFSFHILIIDKYSAKVDGTALACIQFFCCALLSGICALKFETLNFSDVKQAVFPLIYTGVFSSGIAYTLQIIGQKYSSPVLATIVMSLESVFSALAGWIILKDTMSSQEIAGAVLIFTAIICAQIPEEIFSKLFKKKEQN